jgi:isocitrate/isopropylmalate dehydrogenase
MSVPATRKPVYTIASIPGDGIGIEVIAAAITVLEALTAVLGGFKLEFTHLDYGSARYKAQGSYMPLDALSVLKKHDAILFGSVGDPDVPDHVSLWGLLLGIRSPMGLYANVRPVRTFPGTKSYLRGTDHIDWLLIRENSEGEYAGQGGRSHKGTGWEVVSCSWRVYLHVKLLCILHTVSPS